MEGGLRAALDLLPLLPNQLKAGAKALFDQFLSGLKNLGDWLATNPLHPFRRDPLIFDLDGDGIELIGVNASHANFDFDGDGFRERTGWVNSDDGILVRDRNGNGKIDDGSELFGTAQEQGFDVLKKLDSNNDGRIDASDEAFSSLKIWRDLNGDGQSSADELFTLQQLGITSIGLSNNAVNINQDGNVIAYQGSQVSPHFLTRLILTLFSSRTEEFYDRKGNLTWHPFIKRGGRNKILNQIARIASIFGSNFYL